jgi:hypothetical protein
MDWLNIGGSSPFTLVPAGLMLALAMFLVQVIAGFAPSIKNALINFVKFDLGGSRGFYAYLLRRLGISLMAVGVALSGIVLIEVILDFVRDKSIPEGYLPLRQLGVRLAIVAFGYLLSSISQWMRN